MQQQQFVTKELKVLMVAKSWPVIKFNWRVALMTKHHKPIGIGMGFVGSCWLNACSITRHDLWTDVARGSPWSAVAMPPWSRIRGRDHVPRNSIQNSARPYTTRSQHSCQCPEHPKLALAWLQSTFRIFGQLEARQVFATAASPEGGQPRGQPRGAPGVAPRARSGGDRRIISTARVRVCTV